MSCRGFLLAVVLALAMLTVSMGALYDHCIGFPRNIAGHWVHPRVKWYWTWYPPLGYPFPGIVQYVYLDEHGREIKHGPLVERGVRGNTVVLSRTGFYIEDQPDGVFTEYQTYWGTKVAETRYVHGKQVDLKMYPVPSLPARQ